MSLQSLLSQEVLKNNLLPAHTCLCPGPEIDDRITHSKANSMEENTHTACLQFHTYITVLRLQHSVHMQTWFRVCLVFGKRLIIVLFTE